MAGNAAWELQFCSIRLLEPNRIFPSGSQLGDSGLWVHHTAGCHHKIVPGDGFQGLSPGETLRVPFYGEHWVVSRTDVMPNWYVVDPDSEPRVVSSTSGETLNWVRAFDSENKWKRQPGDRYDPYEWDERLSMIDYRDLGDVGVPFLPTPYDLDLSSSSRLNIRTGDWRVAFATEDIRNEAEYLAGKCEVRKMLLSMCLKNIGIDGNCFHTRSDIFALEIDIIKKIAGDVVMIKARWLVIN